MPLATIGRLGGADIELDDRQVSRLHCAIEIKRTRSCSAIFDRPTATYVSDQKNPFGKLEPPAEFRIGSLGSARHRSRLTILGILRVLEKTLPLRRLFRCGMLFPRSDNLKPVLRASLRQDSSSAVTGVNLLGGELGS